MNYDALGSIVSRAFFVGAFLLIVLAVVEQAANLFGYTVLRGAYSAGRLMELAATLVVVVIALLLRQVREELRRKP
jgi:hypothetical protein